MINYGDWQNMPDYREGWVDKHKNAFGDLLRAADPMTYVPGISSVANPIHDMGDAAVTGINTTLSPVIKATNKVLKTVTPGVQYMEDNIPAMGNVNRFIENKPFDAAALAAATFFSGGAAGEALGPSATAAPAVSGGTGAMGGLNSFGAAATNAITPALSGTAAGTGAGAGAGMGGSVGGTLTSISAPSTLGTAGTAAATNAITPALSTLGASTPSFMANAANVLNKGREFKSYFDNMNTMAGPDTNRIRSNNQANAFAQQIINSNSVPTTNTGRIADKIMMKRIGGR